MRFKRIVQAAALFAVAVLSSGATRSNWDSTVVATDAGHLIGNPNAKVKLIEFISYTCPHCAAFAREGEAPLKIGYVAQGQVSLEIRHMLRDPIDLTVAILANCGPVAKFPRNHSAFMLGQDTWIRPAASASAAQQARWRVAGAAGRRAIASDLGFYRMMEDRGYSRPEVDRCLADNAIARKLAESSEKDWARPGVSGTPAFAINGTVLPDTHTWAALERQLKEAL